MQHITGSGMGFIAMMHVLMKLMLMPGLPWCYIVTTIGIRVQGKLSGGLL
jgi:hypothetical protein